MTVTAGKLRLEDRQRLEQEQQSEEKRLAIMMMKKREKYLYKKIMFGKKRKVREVRAWGCARDRVWSLVLALPAPARSCGWRKPSLSRLECLGRAQGDGGRGRRSTSPSPGCGLGWALCAPSGPWLVRSEGSGCRALPRAGPVAEGSICPACAWGSGGMGAEQPPGSHRGSRGGVSPQANKLAAKRKAHDDAVKEEKKKSKKARQA